MELALIIYKGNKMIVEFKKELQALLKKYNAHIEFSCTSNSDLNRVHGEQIEVEFHGIKKSTHVLNKGYFVSPEDL